MTATSPDAAYLQPLRNAFARELDPDQVEVYEALADLRQFTGNFLSAQERDAIASVKRMCGAGEDELETRRRLVDAIHAKDEDRIDMYTTELLGLYA